MGGKKILIITHGFYPEQSPRSFRATELAKEFCRQGHQVTVVAPYREGTEDLAQKYGFQYASLGPLNWGIYNFKSLGVISRLYNKVVNRALPLLFEYPMIELFFKVQKAIKNEKGKYNLLISIAVPYPIHWGVAARWGKNGENIANTWIADCGDPYSLQENDTFRPPFYFRWVEKWFMRKTDYVTVPTENALKGYFLEFHSKLRIIPQGFQFKDIERKEIISDGVIRFGYGGVFIPNKRDPRKFVTYLISLPKRCNFEFHIYTSTPQMLLNFVEMDNRILIHKPINRKELLETFSSFDFVVNFANQGMVQTPSKLIDYSIIGKPILNIETGNLEIDTIQAFLTGDYSKSVHVEGIEKYKIENVSEAFLKLA